MRKRPSRSGAVSISRRRRSNYSGPSMKRRRGGRSRSPGTVRLNGPGGQVIAGNHLDAADAPPVFLQRVEQPLAPGADREGTQERSSRGGTPRYGPSAVSATRLTTAKTTNGIGPARNRERSFEQQAVRVGQHERLGRHRPECHGLVAPCLRLIAAADQTSAPHPRMANRSAPAPAIARNAPVAPRPRLKSGVATAQSDRSKAPNGGED